MLEANNMKNKLSFALLCLTLCCSFSVLAYTENTDSDETPLAYEMSEDELDDVMETCNEIAMEDELQGDELTTFVAECAEANASDL